MVWFKELRMKDKGERWREKEINKAVLVVL